VEVVKNIFIDIHYTEDERNKAESLAKRYEAKGYSREADNDDVIQLLITKTEKGGLS
jgi:hypothetical protein